MQSVNNENLSTNKPKKRNVTNEIKKHDDVNNEIIENNKNNYKNQIKINDELFASGNMNKKYNRETLNLCEIIGSYFVNAFFNSLYLTARVSATNKSTSITQEYKLAILAYSKAINQGGKNYTQTIMSLLDYYKVNTNYLTTTIEEFEIKIIREFVPHQFYFELSKNDHDLILSNIITETVNKFTKFIILPENICKVIDQRKDVDVVKYFQSVMKEYMLERHDIIYGKFITNTKNDKVDAHYVEKLKEGLKLQITEKIKLKHDLNIAKQVAEKIKYESNCMIEDLKKQVNSFQSLLDEKDDKIITLKINLDKLQMDIDKMNNERNQLHSISERNQLTNNIYEDSMHNPASNNLTENNSINQFTIDNIIDNQSESKDTNSSSDEINVDNELDQSFDNKNSSDELIKSNLNKSESEFDSESSSNMESETDDEQAKADREFELKFKINKKK